MNSFQAGRLGETSLRAFFWLLMELLSLPPSCQVDIMSDAQKVVQDGSLLQSSVLETRTYDHKIKHIVQAKSSAPSTDLGFCPDGRHDNDFVELSRNHHIPDFRRVFVDRIAILPAR
jgi:hypothetical protein